jgi:hypothetical protein
VFLLHPIVLLPLLPVEVIQVVVERGAYGVNFDGDLGYVWIDGM